MRRSVLSVVFAAALFSECYAPSAASKMEDAVLDQDMLLSEEMAEDALGPSPAFLGKSGGLAKIIVVGDAGLWRTMGGLALHKQSVLERRDMERQEPGVSVFRRDTRCMVGRVYRPCWEA